IEGAGEEDLGVTGPGRSRGLSRRRWWSRVAGELELVRVLVLLALLEGREGDDLDLLLRPLAHVAREWSPDHDVHLGRRRALVDHVGGQLETVEAGLQRPEPGGELGSGVVQGGG